jgi:two-component system sensor histidine kinase UhpB
MPQNRDRGGGARFAWLRRRLAATPPETERPPEELARVPGASRSVPAESLWPEAFVHNAHGIALIDPVSSTLRTVNAAYAQLVGRTPEQLERQSALSVFPSTEHVSLAVAEHTADLSGTATLQTCQMHRDGALIPVELSLVSVRDAAGAVRYRIQTVTDLRARLRAEGELRFGEAQHTAAARFRQLADSAPVGILLMDANGDCNYANPCWLEITGLLGDVALGDGWWDAVHPEDRDRLSDAWESLMRGAPLNLEFRYRRSGGELRTVQSRAAALRDEAGTVVGFMGVDVDITEQLQQRAAIDGFHVRIRALANRLEHLREDERASIARRLHGTLREDLTTLKAEVEALRAQPTPQAPGELDALAGRIERCLEHLRHITFELQPPGVEELGLTEALQRFAAECAAQSGLVIELSATGGIAEIGRRRSLVLYRAFQEALSNVVRHARAQRVEAHLWAQDGAAHLRISDDGVGIGDRDRGKAGCFGLLSTSERLMQLGGTLRVFGVAGRGTTLDASVPLKAGKARRDSIAR